MPHYFHGGRMTFYDQIAKQYDNDPYDLISTTHTLSLKQIEKQIKIAPNILDLCVGTGNFALALSQVVDFQQFTGIDISEKMVQVARQKLPFSWKPIVDSASMALNHLEEGSQDMILCHYLYSYLSPEELLPMCFKLLKKGGWLSLITSTKEQYDETFDREIDKCKFLSRYLKVRDNIKGATIIESHKAHEKMVEKYGFKIRMSEDVHLPFLVKNTDEIWNLAYDSGWMVKELSKYSPLTLSLIKSNLRLLQVPFFKVFPFHFKLHSSILLVQK